MPDYIKLTITGVREAQIAVEQYGAEVIADARHELENELSHTTDEIRQASQRGGTGNLAQHVTHQMDPEGIGGRIRNSARHAHLVELGHRGAPYKTPHRVQVAPGVFRWVKASGRSKPQHIFVPRVIAARQRFAETLKRVLAKPIPELGPGTVEVRET